MRVEGRRGRGVMPYRCMDVEKEGKGSEVEEEVRRVKASIRESEERDDR